jgi:hypothetical protein
MFPSGKIPCFRLLIAPLFTDEIACKLVATSEIIYSIAISRNPHRNRNSSSDFSILLRGPLCSRQAKFNRFDCLFRQYLPVKLRANW